MLHYVYYLHSLSGALLYVGRSIKPERRLYLFQRRTGIQATLGLCQRHSTLKNACIAELAAISKHKPPMNKVLVSSTGNFGMKRESMPTALRCKIGNANKGKVKSPETIEKLKIARKGKQPNLGRTVSTETREKLRIAGLRISDENRAKVSQAMKHYWNMKKGICNENGESKCGF